MTSPEILGKENWDKLHTRLKKAFKKEIELMREVLSNLREEELLLLKGETKKFHAILGHRSELVLYMGTQRNKREALTEKLKELAKKLGKTELFPVSEEDSCEILTLIDQILALTERINLQNCRNETLFAQAKQKIPLPLECPIPHPSMKKRKTSIATHPRKS